MSVMPAQKNEEHDTMRLSPGVYKTGTGEDSVEEALRLVSVIGNTMAKKNNIRTVQQMSITQQFTRYMTSSSEGSNPARRLAGISR